ncbi:hypothetical protein [Nostoc sp.]
MLIIAFCVIARASSSRLFLQRVGGRYRFIHKLLQDHFAQMQFKRNVD